MSKLFILLAACLTLSGCYVSDSDWVELGDPVIVGDDCGPYFCRYDSRPVIIERNYHHNHIHRVPLHHPRVHHRHI